MIISHTLCGFCISLRASQQRQQKISVTIVNIMWDLYIIESLFKYSHQRQQKISVTIVSQTLCGFCISLRAYLNIPIKDNRKYL